MQQENTYVQPVLTGISRKKMLSTHAQWYLPILGESEASGKVFTRLTRLETGGNSRVLDLKGIENLVFSVFLTAFSVSIRGGKDPHSSLGFRGKTLSYWIQKHPESLRLSV